MPSLLEIMFQPYHGENKLHFDEIMMSALYYKYTNTPSWILIVLVHTNNNPRVDMSLHSDTLFWFRDNQSLLLSLSGAWEATWYGWNIANLTSNNNHSHTLGKSHLLQCFDGSLRHSIIPPLIESITWIKHFNWKYCVLDEGDQVYVTQRCSVYRKVPDNGCQ
jgi:hypothetical protein